MHDDENAEDKEVHFLKIEAEVEKFELGLQAITKLFQRVRNKEFGMSSLNFQDWTIIDFDNCLKGNPHIYEEK